jgi:hypothetical protein
MMKWTGSAAAVALMVSTVTASADMPNPQVAVPSVYKSGAGIPQVTAPSAQNSGAGIAGFAGNKNGPAAQQGMRGSGTVTNMAVAEQDATNVKGLPGSKSGPPARDKVHGGL